MSTEKKNESAIEADNPIPLRQNVEEAIRRYLEDNQLDGKDMLIAVIMPGGLLYAAVRKGNLEQAQAELARLAADMDELSRDLVVMQAVAGELTVAQVQ